MSKHTACDCASYQEHQLRATDPACRCAYPLATVLVERHWIREADLTHHAACDCTSYAQHAASWDTMPYTHPCFGPLATALVMGVITAGR